MEQTDRAYVEELERENAALKAALREAEEANQAKTFDEAIQAAIALEGKRFSPLLTARLRDKRVAERIHQAFDKGRQTAYRQMYNAARLSDAPDEHTA